jgi:hypothetical protein
MEIYNYQAIYNWSLAGVGRLIERGFEEGSIATSGDFVLEPAFVET